MAEMIWNEGDHVEVLDMAGARISGTVDQVARKSVQRGSVKTGWESDDW